MPKPCLGVYLNGDRLSTKMQVQSISSRYQTLSCLCWGSTCFSCTLPAPHPQHTLCPWLNISQKVRKPLIWDQKHKKQEQWHFRQIISACRKENCANHTSTENPISLLCQLQQLFLFCHVDCNCTECSEFPPQLSLGQGWTFLEVCWARTVTSVNEKHPERATAQIDAP